MTIQEAKIFGKNFLNSSPSPVLDTDVLLQFVTGFNKTKLLFERNFLLTGEMESQFKALLEKRSTGYPVAYLTGTKEFFGYNFYVTPDVLIPKPDTEILVEQGINQLEKIIKSNQDFVPEDSVSVCDMCTGSGCVGLSIFKSLLETNLISENTKIDFTLADLSPEALKIAETNSKRLIPENLKNKIHFSNTNLFEKIADQKFDIIVTNPPYVPHSESVELLKDGRSEPLLALDGDVDLSGNSTGQNDGLGLIRFLIPQAKNCLKAGGWIFMETGEYNAEATEKLLKENGFCETGIVKDLEGQLRVVKGKIAD